MHRQLYLHLVTNQNQLDSTTFWTMVAALAAIIGVYVAWSQFSKFNEITNAEFLNTLSKNFFTSETRELFTLLMNSCLVFKIQEILKEGEHIDELPFFEIEQDIRRQIVNSGKFDLSRKGYTAFEIDDLLLGHFTDLERDRNKKLITIEGINQTFGYYIINTYENPEIKKYLLREDNEGKYEELKNLYLDCKAYKGR